MAIRALEFYSGLGGLHRALSRSNVDGTVAGAFDWDQNACRVYRANYGTNVIHKVDISTLTASELRTLAFISIMSAVYRAKSLAKGAADPRAKSFIHLVEDVLPELASYGAHPHYLLVENVAGFETSSTRQRLLTTLHSLNYAVLELLLTPLQFGIPNSRLRYYLLAKANFLTFAHVQGCEPKTWRHIPGHGHDWIDPRLQTEGIQETYFKVAKIRKFLDTDAPKGYMHPCAVPDHVLEKWGRLFDIVLPSSCRSCCFTRGYAKMAERSGSVLQMNEKLDTTNVFDRFLEAQSRGEKDAVRILDPLELRYFSPRELLRIFCFSPPAQEELQSDFIWPDDTSVKTQYRLIGNSVNVFVVTELINYLFE